MISLTVNRLSSHATNKGEKGKMTDFHENWPDWSTHGWGWPCKVFWTWGHPNRFWESTLIVDLHLNTKFSFDFWCAWKLFIKYGNCQPINVRFMSKKGPKNCPILMKFCVHIVQTSDYHHKKFHQNRTIYWPFFVPESHIYGLTVPIFGKNFPCTPKSKWWIVEKIWLWQWKVCI